MKREPRTAEDFVRLFEEAQTQRPYPLAPLQGRDDAGRRLYGERNGDGDPTRVRALLTWAEYRKNRREYPGVVAIMTVTTPYFRDGRTSFVDPDGIEWPMYCDWPAESAGTDIGAR